MFYVELAFGRGKNIEGWEKTHGMWFVHRMARVDPIRSMTATRHKALILFII